jgi:hypothetical protein
METGVVSIVGMSDPAEQSGGQYCRNDSQSPLGGVVSIAGMILLLVTTR